MSKAEDAAARASMARAEQNRKDLISKERAARALNLVSRRDKNGRK